jgi:hypothetical protein
MDPVNSPAADTSATQNAQPEVSGGTPPEGTTPPTAPKGKKSAPKKAKAPEKKLSKVAFIDQAYLKATKNGKAQIPKGTAEAIFKEVKAKYHIKGEQAETATMRTIRCRPWHLRQKKLLVDTTRGSQKGSGKKETAAASA